MAVWPLLAVTKTGLALGGAGRVAVGLVGSATRSSVVGAAASPAAAATQLFARLQQLHLALAAAAATAVVREIKRRKKLSHLAAPPNAVAPDPLAAASPALGGVQLAALAVGLALGLAVALMLRSKRGRADDPPIPKVEPTPPTPAAMRAPSGQRLNGIPMRKSISAGEPSGQRLLGIPMQRSNSADVSAQLTWLNSLTSGELSPPITPPAIRKGGDADESPPAPRFCGLRAAAPAAALAAPPTPPRSPERTPEASPREEARLGKWVDGLKESARLKLGDAAVKVPSQARLPL